MLFRRDLFNPESICIFTDSSFCRDSKKRDGIGTVAPAYCVFNDMTCIDQGFGLLYHATSQQGELYAILLGIMAMVKYQRDFKYFRLFSDSESSVLGVRDRIFKWINTMNNGGNTLGDTGRIANQDYIMNIIYMILSNNIPIELYHIKGHVNPRDFHNIERAKGTFKMSNYVYDLVEDGLIYQLVWGNTMVDEYSTSMLHMHMNLKSYRTDKLKRTIKEGGYIPFDEEQYKTLILNSYREDLL